MIKIWNEAFWKETLAVEKKEEVPIRFVQDWSWILPIGFLAGVTLLLGFGIGPIFHIVSLAGYQLMNPQFYIQAVLGGGG
jgi:multicomponent Na+:H+ antiporter subunit D